MSGWTVRVRDEPLTMRVSLLVGIEDSNGRIVQVLDGTGEIHTVEPDAVLPDNVLIQIPRDAWRSLGEMAAGHSHLGAENKVLREALNAERARVDRFLQEAMNR